MENLGADQIPGKQSGAEHHGNVEIHGDRIPVAELLNGHGISGQSADHQRKNGSDRRYDNRHAVTGVNGTVFEDQFIGSGGKFLGKQQKAVVNQTFFAGERNHQRQKKGINARDGKEEQKNVNEYLPDAFA